MNLLWLYRLWARLFRSRNNRAIFTYSIGGEIRYSDPIEIDKLLVRHGGEDWGQLIDAVSKLKRPLNPVSEMAMGADAIKERKQRFDQLITKLVELSRAVFDLPALSVDGSGYSSIEAIAVMTAYVNFIAKLTEESRAKSVSPG